MFNSMLQPLSRLGYSQGVQRVPLMAQVNIHALRLRLTGNVVVTGGAANGTLVAEGERRFLRSVRVVHDGNNIVQPLNGRDLFQLYKFTSAAAVAPTIVTAATAATYPIACDFVIPFARQYLARPIETVWPASVPVNELALFVEFDTSTTNGTSQAGSGAFITGGDRTVTLTNIQLEVLQEYSEAPLPAGPVIDDRGTRIRGPWYLPQISVATTEQYTAARADLPLLLTDRLRFDAVLFQNLVNTTEVAAQFNRLSFLYKGGSRRGFDAVDLVQLQRRTLGLFSAATVENETGRLFQLFADNGNLGNAPDPRSMGQPRFTFDVPAPAGNIGQVRCIFLELATRPGYTQVPA